MKHNAAVLISEAKTGVSTADCAQLGTSELLSASTTLSFRAKALLHSGVAFLPARTTFNLR